MTVSCDPKALAEAAKCFCLDKRNQTALDAWLLCQIATLSSMSNLLLDSALADQTGAGIIVEMTHGDVLAFGGAIYIDAAGTARKASAAVAGKFPAIGISLSATSPGNILLYGIIRNDAWAAWTVGGKVYLDVSVNGLLTQTPSVLANSCTQVIGVALAAKVLLINPSPDYITHS